MINGIDRVWELYVILTQVYGGEKILAVYYIAAILTKSSANGSHAIHEATSLIKIRKKKGKSCAKNVIYTELYPVSNIGQLISSAQVVIELIFFFCFYSKTRYNYYQKMF